MNRKLRKFTAMAAAAVTAVTSAAASVTVPMTSLAKYGTGREIVEYLDRGISAFKTSGGMFVSWRFLANDPDDAEFKLYRDDKLIYTSKSGEATCYLDKDGNANSKYKVECISGGKVVNSENCKIKSGSNYIDIKMDSPGSQYSPNDTSVGDVDGDGVYELFVKWDPSNQKDNSQEGTTDNVYIDCYSILQNKRLWRIDLGKNIRAGSHYTQHLVADFDCDGKAEMMCKTADGTVDGAGKVIGDKSKDYRNGKGYILDGPEYYTLFDGATGKALDTIDYPFPRGKVSDWGDNYGNRVDRFLGAVAYLDGVHPSAITVRGYYTRMTAAAVDVVDKKLKVRWKFDSNDSANKAAYSNGNHNCMAADVDGDGKQELVLGATCIDHDGKLLWCTGMGHGDAMHLGDLLPDRKGQEVWVCHEENGRGMSLIDASNGKIIFNIKGSGDTGRACADNVWAGNKGAEFWGAASGNTFDGSGKQIASKRPAQNFLIYWDGDLERETLDGTKIGKMKSATDIATIFNADGCASNNGTKSVPCLAADIFGDWREELLMRTSDNKAIRIYSTTDTTKYRLTTLMHDTQYRCQAAGEQNCYNQPAHASFYLGSDQPLPERPAVTVNGKSTGGNDVVIPEPTEDTTEAPTVAPTETPTAPPESVPTGEIIDGGVYRIRNVNSGLCLSVENNNAANQANVQQGGDTMWKLVSQGSGYYCLVAQIGGNDYALDVHAKKTANETNIELYTFNGGDNQQFRLSKNDDGSFTILTKITGDASCLDVAARSSDNGANVQQYAVNGSTNQRWILESTDEASQPSTETPSQPQQPVQDILYGDANCDGEVTIADATAIMQSIGNPDVYSLSEQGKCNADVYGSGDGVTGMDALTIQQVDAKLIQLSQLPIK